MNIIFILLPLSILLGLIFLIGYCWSVKNGQLDDLETPARRVLLEDKVKKIF